MMSWPRTRHRRKPYRKGLTPYYFAAAQPGLSGNEQFFYFTSLVRSLMSQQHSLANITHCKD